LKPSSVDWLRAVALIGSLVAFVSVTSAQVVINELHYHPADWAVLPEEDPDDLEFIELFNAGPTTVDLSGWSIGPGIVHTFPPGVTMGPGEFLILAEDAVFLDLRGPSIPSGVQIFAWDSGGLSNGGELIQLLDDAMPTPVVMDEVLYDDTGLWPNSPDGGGPSLELIHPEFDNAYPLVWCASTGTNGTPGLQNSCFSEAPIVLWEDPPRTSIVSGPTEIAVIFAKPVSGVVPADLIVASSVATGVTCGTCVGGTGAGPYVFDGFAAPLISPVIVTLGPGSIQDTDSRPFAGDAWIYSLQVPEIVFNEIHYNPTGLADLEEFVELYNAEPDMIDISGWSITEFADTPFVFPPGTMVAAGDYVVVAKDPPALQSATGYLTPHRWPTGSLSNEDEAIQILDGSGVQVDRVQFDDVPPWPREADGDGPSAELVNPAIDNSAGQAWRASTIDNGTPGALNSTYTDAPIVTVETPSRGSVIETLSTVTVTFSEPVRNVAASNLTVAGSPATSLTCSTCVGGEGAGPYQFGGFAAPTASPVFVSMPPGSIEDLDADPFSGDSWLYSFSLPRVVINEINYNTPSVGDVEEFIELHNMESSPVAVSGWSISGFADTPFVFQTGILVPANGFVVVAQDPAALLAATGCSTPHQWPEGKLGDGGEPLSLTNEYGFAIDFVEFDDAVPWPLQPDGNGPSLELVNPNLDNAVGQTWRASVGTFGTPGQLNSEYTLAPIVMGEDPPRGAIVPGLQSVSVLFSEPVTGVTPDDLLVASVQAGAVSGSGAGPYLFDVTSPPPGAVTVSLVSGGIQDLDASAFTGDSWIYVNDQASLSMPANARGGPGDTVLVPIVAAPATGIQDAEISVLFDATLLEALGVSKTTLSQQLALTEDLSLPGEADITLTGTTPMAGTGAIVNILFRVSGAAIPGQTSVFDLDLVVLNQGGISPYVIDGLFTVCDNSDADHDGVSLCGGDCDDGNPARFPGNPEVCDNVDNDCNGQVDDNVPQPPTTCGVGECVGNVGQLLCIFGNTFDTCDPMQGSTMEVCDGLDNDCDGPVDETFTDTDVDGTADCVDPDDDADGVDDFLDCAPLNPLFWDPPLEVTGLVLDGADPTTLDWSALNGVVYDAAGGLLGELRADDGTDEAQCLEDDLADSGFMDERAVPVAGEGFYYIIRAQHVCTGTYGHATAGPERLPTGACP